VPNDFMALVLRFFLGDVLLRCGPVCSHHRTAYRNLFVGVMMRAQPQLNIFSYRFSADAGLLVTFHQCGYCGSVGEQFRWSPHRDADLAARLVELTDGRSSQTAVRIKSDRPHEKRPPPQRSPVTRAR